jgi:hypothetical protein
MLRVMACRIGADVTRRDSEPPAAFPRPSFQPELALRPTELNIHCPARPTTWPCRCHSRAFLYPLRCGYPLWRGAMSNPGGESRNLASAHQKQGSALGIDIAFSREGRAGNRVIRMRTSVENTVSTVSSVRDGGLEPGPEQYSPGPASAVWDDSRRAACTPDPAGAQYGRDDADGADAEAASPFG